MPSGLLTLVLGAAMQVGQPAPTEIPNYPTLPNANQHYGFEGQYEQRYPFDSQQNWVHGYFQEIPAYGGHVFYRPYNYKDVLSQSQTAAGWGAAPQLPYSQQFWHRYHDQATMLKLSRSERQAVPERMNAAPEQTYWEQVQPAAAQQTQQPSSGPFMSQVRPEYVPQSPQPGLDPRTFAQPMAPQQSGFYPATNGPATNVQPPAFVPMTTGPILQPY